MADQTVPERPKHYGHDDALEDLRRTARAASIVRAVSLAVEAQQDGVVTYEGETMCRWWGSIDAAIWSIRKVRDVYMNTSDSPNSVDWCTPLNLLEAMGAALFQLDVGPNKNAMTATQVRDLCEAVLESLSALHDDLSAAAKELQGGAA